MTVIPEAGEGCERLGQDSGPCMTCQYALCWTRMLESVVGENKSRRSCWLRWNGTIVAALRVQVYAGSSIAHRCPCELC